MSQQSFASVETDCGIAEVFHQGPRLKPYLCPMCETEVAGEWHVVIRPTMNHALRRHAHKECYEEFVAQNLVIKLLPGRKSFV